MSARKTERLLNLVICLLATRRYLSAEQIRHTVAGYEDLGDDAFKRKFERDKEDLRDLGIPLETGSDSVFDDEPGYRIRRDDYSLPDIAFEPAELAVLGVAARTWQQASLSGQAFEAVTKLRAAGIDIDDAVPVAIETRVSTSEPAFEPLRQAATDRRPVEFDYREAGARRHVEPWGLVSWHGRWYLVARDTDRGEPRVFRISRIVGPVRTVGAVGSVDVPPDTDIRAFVRRMDADGDRLSATLRIRAGAAVGLRRRAASVVPLDADWDEVKLLFADVQRLTDEVVAYGGEVVVVEPAQAREAIVVRLRTVLR